MGKTGVRICDLEKYFSFHKILYIRQCTTNSAPIMLKILWETWFISKLIDAPNEEIWSMMKQLDEDLFREELTEYLSESKEWKFLPNKTNTAKLTENLSRQKVDGRKWKLKIKLIICSFYDTYYSKLFMQINAVCILIELLWVWFDNIKLAKLSGKCEFSAIRI